MKFESKNNDNDITSKSIILRPMNILTSLLFFGIPSLIIWFCVYYLMQKLNSDGINDYLNFYISLVTPLILMLIVSLVAYRLEGNRFNWTTFAKRFRLKKMNKGDWFWTLGLLLFSVIIYGSLNFTAKWLIQFELFAPPKFLIPAADPRIDNIAFNDFFMGLPLKGQWWIPLTYFFALLFNIFGEEFWWRGYILPKQELVFKKWTWVVHGFLWGLFHIFWKWNIILFLPISLALSYVVCTRKNTWIGIISHMGLNSITLIGIIIGTIG